MTEMPPGRPSEPRTGPAAPAPAHGDGPTGPSAPTGRTALRDRIAEALTARFIARHGSADEIIRSAHRDHADAILPVVEAETAALRERAENAEADAKSAWQNAEDWYEAAQAAQKRAEQAERERDEERTIRQQTEEALAIAHDTSNQSERARQAAERALAQARDAIADERRGRLAAEAAVRRVRALHQPTQGQGYNCDEDDTPGSYGDIAQVCTSCGTADEYGVRWPCPTIAALDAEQPKETP